MKGIVHIHLKIFPYTLNTKGKSMINKHTLLIDKNGLMLINWLNSDLVVSRKIVGKGKSMETSKIVNSMVN